MWAGIQFKVDPGNWAYYPKPFKKIIEIETASTLNNSDSNIENVVAAIALSLAMSEKAPKMNIANKNSGSSNWFSIGQQKLFKSREV